MKYKIKLYIGGHLLMVTYGYALIYEEHKILYKILRILQAALVAGLIYNIVALLHTAYIFG